MTYVRSFPFQRLSLATLIAGIMVSSGPSHAGFEFKSSPVMQAPSESPLPPVPALPPKEVDETTLEAPQPGIPSVESSLIVEPTPPSASFEGVPVEPMMNMAAEPVSAVPLPVETPASVTSPSFPEAVGFGSGIPLVLALREIVPPQYAYSFASSVDQGALVTWNGGKPWNVALSEAVKPLNLDVRISGSTVEILPLSPVDKGDSDHEGLQSIPSETPAAPPLAASIISAPGSVSSAPAGVSEVYVRRNPVSGGEISPVPGTVREVYVHRNEEGVQVVNRVSGAAMVNPVPQPEQGEKAQSPSFWSRMKGEIWDDSEKSPEESSEDLIVPPASPVAGSAVEGTVAEPVSLTQDNIMNPSADATTAIPLPAGGAVPEAEPVKTISFDPYAIQSWQAEKGDSLRDILDKWSDKVNVKVQWEAAEDYRLPQTIRLQGTYTEALTRVLSSYESGGGKKPFAQLMHSNLPESPSVLVIKSDG